MNLSPKNRSCNQQTADCTQAWSDAQSSAPALSHAQIEEIAKVLIDDFDKFLYDDNDEPRKMPRPTPIDRFAEDYLGLEVHSDGFHPTEVSAELPHTAIQNISQRNAEKQ